MLEKGDPALRWRGLLTETLPYEVPVIFSNDLLYASLVKPSADPQVYRIVEAMRKKIFRFSIPYNYRIAKDEFRFTSLSIIHPNHQMEINEFYELYKQSIIDYCGSGEVSLRRPISEMAFYSANPLNKEQEGKQGIPHIIPEDGEIDVSRMTSYFSYGRYNLLGKFVESSEYRKLEKQFRFLRTADIGKCFFNIYTHSVTWAVKGKEYSKSYSDIYSFEFSFDKLMQSFNYNETNGIVVGPEISRIFAEIILQDIDRRIIRSMEPRNHNVDYAVRRYVDDFFLFAQDKTLLDKMMRNLESELERYKLFLNTDKTETVTRPFVSPITLARSELKGLIASMHQDLDNLGSGADVAAIIRSARDLRRRALDIRLISQRHEVSFSALSGWLLTTLRTLLRRAVGVIRRASDDESRAALTDMAVIILEIAFYIGALDTRVRATYSLCQIIGVLDDLANDDNVDVVDRLIHTVGEELNGMIRSILNTREAEFGDCVELYNLMIVGAHFLRENFLKSQEMRDALGRLLTPPLTYFGYVTAKFCLLKDAPRHAAELNSLNATVRDRIVTGKDQLRSSAELYLLACDYLSAPDISPADKRTMIETLCGGQPSNVASVTAGRYLGFVDWTGMRIGHVLARKELRPVYSWS